MMRPLPVIGIPCDVRMIDIHPFHAVGEKYIDAVAHGAGAIPMLIPCFGEGGDLEPLEGLYAIDDLLDRVDGIFLPGSPERCPAAPLRWRGTQGLHHAGYPAPIPWCCR